MRKYMMFLGGLVIGAMLMLTSSAVADSITKVINATFNSNLAVTLDGKPVTLEKGSINYKDTNYLSVREVAKLSGLDINWNEKTKTVEIKTTSKKENEQNAGAEQPSDNNQTLPAVAGKDEVFYNFSDIGSNLRKIYGVVEYNNLNLTRKVVDWKSVIVFKDQEYYPQDNIDSFYDSKNDRTYYTSSFLLQFLSSEELAGLPKYSIDISKKTIVEIN